MEQSCFKNKTSTHYSLLQIVFERFQGQRHGLALSSFSLFLIVVVIIHANVDHILSDTILLDILHGN